MQTWMPAIHGGMTNAAFSSSVGERKFMRRFVEIEEDSQC
jgi:hypothetical protein